MPASPRTRRLVWVIGAVAGVGVALTGASPVGISGIDQVMVVAAVTVAVWASSTAPWWMFVAAGAVTAVAAWSWWAALVCAGVVAVALARRLVKRVRLGRWALAIQAGVLVQVLARLGDVGPVWRSAAIAFAVMLALGISGVRRRRRGTRRIVWWSVAGVAAFAVLAGAAMAAAAWSVRRSVSEGLDTAQAGAELLESGDETAAAVEFDRASEALQFAERRLDSWLTQPARLVPVLAQHRDVAADLVAAGATIAEQLSVVGGLVGENSYQIQDGRIDVDAVRALNLPVAALSSTITELRQTIDTSRSPWLHPMIGERLDDAYDEIVRQEDVASAAAAAIAAAPALLGADEPRVYFVAFTTPAEARGLGGFMGNYAEITIDRGEFSMTEFGRTSVLQDAGTEPRTLTGVTPEFADTYADFIFRDLAEREVWPQAWSNITVSPHFPSDASMIAELYPKSGGRPVDGVFVMDVYALAEVMKMTGPVTIDEVGVTVTGEDAVDFLLFDQYLLEDEGARVDLLEVLARTTIERVLDGALPRPSELVANLRPTVQQRNLMGWAALPDEQAVFEQLGVDGSLPEPADGDALHIGFFNASPSKIDTFLTPSAEYLVDTSGDLVSSTLTITAHNTAPPAGMPSSLIGNELELPDGTNRSFVTIHSAHPLTALLVDGRPVSWGSSTEQGYTTNSFFVEMAAGQRVTITATMVSERPTGDYRLRLTTPPLAQAFPVSVVVDGTPLGGGPVTRSGSVVLVHDRP